jgi:hypothetical protein
MKAKTLSLLYCKVAEAEVFQERQKVQFVVFLFLVWFVVL